jgi:DNA-binding beta-propeller fold protein YncE
MYKFIFICILPLYLLTCTERARDNIFDPNSGIGTIDIGLRAIGLDQHIQLDWYSPGEIDYNSIQIYRKSPFSDRFKQLVTLPIGRFTYLDTVSVRDESYTYYITLIGEDYESPPSRLVEAIAGPGDIWILDRWDFEALNLSYDLQVVKRRRYGIWIPENMTIDPGSGTALITYPSYGYFEIFNVTDTYDRLFGFSDLEHPFDCLFEPSTRSFWISDSSGSLYKVNPRSGNLSSLSTNLSQPTQLGLYDNHTIYLLDKGSEVVYRFNIAGDNRGELRRIGDFVLQSPKLFTIDNANQTVYLVDQTETGDILYSFKPEINLAAALHEAEQIDAIAVDEDDQSVWIVQRIDFNSKIMQLSPEGIRLTELEGYDYPIDLGVNPYNGNLIIIDAGTSTVWHLRPDKTIIGRYTKAIQPYKVLIE